MTGKTAHLGCNVKRLREMMGIKQEALAIELGEDWNQKKISQLETKEEIDPALLALIAKALNMPVEAIKNFDEEAVFNIVSNTYNNTSNEQSTLIAGSVNYQPTFNTIEKIVELYERMLKQHETLIARLEQLLEEKK